MINVFQPCMGQEELDAIGRVFASNWLGKGALTKEFEERFASHLGTDALLCRSTNCCSEGLFNSMQVLNIGPGDEVIMPTISFVGAGNAVKACGAKLVLCDVDKRSLNVRAEDIEKKITKRTKAVLLLHFGGIACDIEGIQKLAKEHNFYIIEDSACSVASRYKGKALGTFGDMSMWSFDAMKILVCGDGGMLWFKNEELANKAEKIMYFGLESKSGFSNAVDKKWWAYELSCFGHRAIMNDITASIALEQLKKLPSFIASRKAINDIYNAQLGELAWLDLPPVNGPEYESSYYFYWIQVKNGKRDELAKYLREKGIYTTFRYYPLHWVDLYGVKEQFENAEYAANNTLCIPIHQSLTESDVGLIIDSIKSFEK